MASGTPQNLSHPKYRPDIDGLRAIAVVSVVAFHAFPNRVTGGFVGVDIFFAISGYLISTIIFENLHSGTFTFKTFYARRIRRIFPALLLVLTASVALGWFALLAVEFKQLGGHVAAGAGFVSNLVLWIEAGYFDNSSETKPLLHLWSLGIEEQFYIVWPLLLWIAWKSRINLLVVALTAAGASFVLNAKGISEDAVATFYSPQTRFWELLSGAILAWAAGNWKRDRSQEADFSASAAGAAICNYLSALGLLLIVYGISRFEKTLSFPGMWAAVPVLGSALIIAAGPHAWINRSILSSKVAVWIGLISYPLYLWHWPLLSFARIAEGEEPAPGVRAGAVLIAVPLAWLTYRFVEHPFRAGRFKNRNSAVLVLMMVMVGVLGYEVHRRDGLSFRADERENFVRYFENSFPDWNYFKNANLVTEWRAECAFFNTKKYMAEGKLAGGVIDSQPVRQIDSACFTRDTQFEKSVLIWGDSHAQALSPGMAAFMPGNWQILQIASSGCVPSADVAAPSPSSQCRQSNYFAMKTIGESKPDVVVIAQAHGHDAVRMQKLAAKLRSLGVKKVLFLGPVPLWTTDLPKIVARQLWVRKPQRTRIGVNQETIRLNERLKIELQESKDMELVDVVGLFCNQEGCLVYTGDDMKSSLTAWDNAHLTPSGSRFLAENLLIKRVLD